MFVLYLLRDLVDQNFWDFVVKSYGSLTLNITFTFFYPEIPMILDPKVLFHHGLQEIPDFDFLPCNGYLGIMDPKFLFCLCLVTHGRSR